MNSYSFKLIINNQGYRQSQQYLLAGQLLFIMIFPADNAGRGKHAEENHFRPLLADNVNYDKTTVGHAPDWPAQLIFMGVQISAAQGYDGKNPTPDCHI
jgi:hypothetical protein